MFKTTIAAAAAAIALAPAAALAGPYVNVEANSGWTGSDYNSTTTDMHVGYEGELGESASYYVQGGASVVSPDGAESDTVPSGKAGLGLALTDALGAYGEVSFVGSGDADIDRGYGIPFFYEKIFYNFHNESRSDDLSLDVRNDSIHRDGP